MTDAQLSARDRAEAAAIRDAHEPPRDPTLAWSWLALAALLLALLAVEAIGGPSW